MKFEANKTDLCFFKVATMIQNKFLLLKSLILQIHILCKQNSEFINHRSFHLMYLTDLGIKITKNFHLKILDNYIQSSIIPFLIEFFYLQLTKIYLFDSIKENYLPYYKYIIMLLAIRYQSNKYINMNNIHLPQ